MKQAALKEFKKMWTWLYQHPAHDKKYYVKHVAKPEGGWKNDCPLCELSGGHDCTECLDVWDHGSGSLCEDPESPLNKWKKTHLSDPNYRTWYAGKLIDITEKTIAKS